MSRRKLDDTKPADQTKADPAPASSDPAPLAYPIDVGSLFPKAEEQEDPADSVPLGAPLRRFKVWVESKTGGVHPVCALIDKAAGVAYLTRPLASKFRRPAGDAGARYHGVPTGFLTEGELRLHGLENPPRDFIRAQRPRTDLTSMLFRGIVVEGFNKHDAQHRYMQLTGVTRTEHWRTEQVPGDHPLGVFEKLKKTPRRQSA